MESETERLEELWAGQFGDAYVDRNIHAVRGREVFWNGLLESYPVGNVLEVGCNVGANLEWICKVLPPRRVYGVDINHKALEILRERISQANAVWAAAKELPFRDKWFDLVFTAGVLIHQPEGALHLVMSEALRCSRRYVLCMEYFAEETVEVPYRGQERALFKRDYGRMYMEAFPELKLLEQGMLTRDQGWDDVKFWMLEKVRG